MTIDNIRDTWAWQFALLNANDNYPGPYLVAGRKLWDLNKFEWPSLKEDLELVLMDHNYRVDLASGNQDPFFALTGTSFLNNFVIGQKLLEAFGIGWLIQIVDTWYNLMEKADYTLAPSVRNTLYSLGNNRIIVGKHLTEFETIAAPEIAMLYLSSLKNIVERTSSETHIQFSDSFLRILYQTGALETFCKSVDSLRELNVNSIRILESSYILGCEHIEAHRTSLELLQEIVKMNPWILEIKMKKYFPRPPNFDGKLWYDAHPEVHFSLTTEEFLKKDNGWLDYDPLSHAALGFYGIFEKEDETRYLFMIDIDANETIGVNPYKRLQNLGLEGYLLNSGQNYHFISRALFSLDEIIRYYGLIIMEFCPEIDIGRRLYESSGQLVNVNELTEELTALGKVGAIDLKYIGEAIRNNSYNLRISAGKRHKSPPILVAEI